jgi:hypothetical protein
MMIKARVSDRDVNKMTKRLGKMRSSSIPQAVRNTLNDIAFEAREKMQQEIATQFILRNRFIKSRVIVKKARQRNIRDMQSETGHTEKSMKLQEEGGTARGKGKKKPIPTTKSRIGKSLQRMVSKRFWMSRINTGNSNITLIKPSGKKLGIYRKIRGRLEMLYDLSKSSVELQKRPWMKPAVKRVATKANMNRLFIKNANRLLKK